MITHTLFPYYLLANLKKFFSFDYVIKQLTGKCFYYFRKMDDIALDQPAGRIELDSTCKSLWILEILVKVKNSSPKRLSANCRPAVYQQLTDS